MTKKDKKKRNGNTWRTLLALLCLIIGLLLIFMDPIKDWLIAQMSDDYAVSKLDADQIKKNMEKKGDFDFSKVKSLDLEMVLNARFLQEEMDVIGGISIPSISLNLPILNGLDNNNLIVGAGTMKSSQVMGEGNYALASHRMINNPRLLFSPLFELKGGETIYLTDLTDVYIYEVSNLEKVDVTRVDVIDDVPGEALVTLVTCDFNLDIRLIVQGTFKEKVSVKKAPKEAIKAFNLEQNAR